MGRVWANPRGVSLCPASVRGGSGLGRFTVG
ncbi:hypothetical protein PSTT_03672 [Puccinia striiformis]|uniref:Uncharacterized protein n=1 Tax=Puccinia striiformis TaxID=27350 RepID=A0A2S4VVH0_9BASI|nr:hypothetical protein PSTT_03672 [Puccinia striiformis]